ncbi:ABC transporter substrate-binding protein [Microbacterium sp. CJ77]|uniref:ABC transporter substrate-binding protein n=1 Tax=Microbacterium sp. CJ77 TaxID=2079201 RepID=UPI000CD8EECC|nr:ABC transporter substrate-binding protein [Microbacterium sp. CJ77]
MSRARKLTMASAMIAATAIALSGCAASGSDAGTSDGLQTVTLGITPYQDTYLTLVGMDQGWFEEAGIDLQLKKLAWNNVMTAVVSGDVDMAIQNTTGVIAVANTDPDLVYAFGYNPFTEGTALMIRPDGLETVAQLEKGGLDHDAARTAFLESLRGKEVVTTLSTDMGKQIIAALDSVGIAQSEVNFIDLDSDSGLAAFLAGTGDAYLGGIPQRQTLVDAGMLVGISGPDLSAPEINGIVTKRDFASTHQDVVLSFINVMFRTIRYCDANEDACAELITTALNQEAAGGMTVEGWKSFWQTLELHAVNAAQAKEWILEPDGIAYWKTTWDAGNEYFLESDSIPAPVDGAQHFLMPEMWDAYVAEYGADETGY